MMISASQVQYHRPSGCGFKSGLRMVMVNMVNDESSIIVSLPLDVPMVRFSLFESTLQSDNAILKHHPFYSAVLDPGSRTIVGLKLVHRLRR